ncbi:MAG: double-strand break repair protein AddB [Alphaproteobacteria bacterium]
MATRVHTIAPDLPFVDVLAAGLLDRVGEEPAALSRAIVLLPTRRACRALREAFLRRSGGRPLLLPRLLPLGALDEDEPLFAGSAAAMDLPPEMPPLRRQLLLTRLILAGRGGHAGGGTPGPEQAARLALELAGLLDQVQTERLSFDRLATLVPEDYAAHWQITLDFLKLLTEVWPTLLRAENRLDPAPRRDRLAAAQGEAWRARPPAGPVIAAGSTGSIPATADLLKVVASLPRGAVVLPGLDRDMDDESWEALDESHPQYGLKRLLGHLGVERGAVTDWPAPPTSPDHRRRAHPDRRRLIAEAMRPATTTHRWRDLPSGTSIKPSPPPSGGRGLGEGGAEIPEMVLVAPPPHPGPLPLEGEREQMIGRGPSLSPAALEGVERIDCPGPREEALAIALLMRETLEFEGRTAALITPDRALARRVVAELGRWDIVIDDSAGRPLAETPPGVFLRLTAAMVAEDFAPFALLAALKHPLAAGGLAEARFRALVRQLELRALRGPRPAPGLSGLRAALSADDSRLASWLGDLEALVAPFAALMAAPEAAPAALVKAHMEFAEALAASADLPGPARLWAGEAGLVAATFAAELHEAADVLPAMAPRHYPGLLETLMAGAAVRPDYGGHPRLAIWGPLEARMQHPDLLILGGLNEGTWPPQTLTDPWMSRPMRSQFGLPLPERRIGLSAHDFAQAFCAPRVVMTRARRVEGTPTVASRWLFRLEAVMRAAGLDEVTAGWRAASPWRDLAAVLDQPACPDPVIRPAPRPPVAARPSHLSVTEVETWMRDPYGIYARHVLRLRALQDIDADAGAADYGSRVHAALDAFARAYPGPLPDDALDQLLTFGRDAFASLLDLPAVAAFWWPRFQRIAAWVIAREHGRRAIVSSVLSEISGRLEVPRRAGGTFALSAKADRIDLLRDGTLAILDYKTGRHPSVKEVAAGYAPQLPLEAGIARAGGFPGVPARPVSALLYWRLRGGGSVAGEERSAGDDPMALADAALAGLRGLIDAFDDPATPYEARPHPGMAPAYSDYLHLARVKEWANGGDDGE